jgi:redox-regulated HSP33 family molecular chaperone
MFPAVSPKKTSERKIELHKEAQAYKKNIDGQVNDLKTEAARIGTTALIVGTALAGVYVLFNLLTSESKEEKKIKVVENSNLPVVVKKDKSGDSWIVSSIKGYIATFVLAFAKDKIMQAIAMLKENNDPKSTK